MQFPLTLTENNARKLVNGHPIQLRNKQLHGTDHYLMLHPMQHARLSKAKAMGKGARLALTPEELAASGQGFGDLWNKVRKGAQWVSKNIVQTPFYQKNVRPVVKQAVEAAVAALPLPAPVSNIAKASIEKLGDTTSAFGLALPQSGNALEMEQPKKGMPQSGIPKPRAKPKARAKKAAKALPQSGNAKSAPSGSFLIN